MSDRFAFFNDAPDLTGFAWPEGGPEDVGDAAPPTSRVQIAKTGTFTHPRYGKFTVNRDTYTAFIRNFTAGVPTDRLPVDFDHTPDMGGPSEACGWITALEADGNALFATVEWMWRGAYALKDQTYRYVSPTWSLNWVDESGAQRGPTMLAFGLTNRPFFTLPAVSLSATFSRDDYQLAVEQVEEPAAPRRPHTFTEALKGIADPRQRQVIADTYNRDPHAAEHALELLLTARRIVGGA